MESTLEAAKDGVVLVVAGDPGITKALDDVDDVVVYETVRELLESDEFEDFRGEVENYYLSSLLTTVEKSMSEFTQKFSEVLVDEVGGTTVTHHDSYDDIHNEYYVSTAGVVEWQIDFADHEYLGDGVISMPFKGLLEVSVDTSTGDYFEDAQYGTSEDAFVRVDGWMSIIVEDPSILQKAVDWEPPKLLHALTVQIDEIYTKLTDFERGRTKFEAEEDDATS